MFRKALAMALIALFILSSASMGFAGVQLSDIAGHWGQANIQALVDRDGIAGYADGTFKPDKSITNAEFITILMQGLQERSIPPTNENWYSGSVDEALATGVLKAGDIDSAAMNNPISRYVMALLMSRATTSVLKEERADTSATSGMIADYQAVASQTKYKDAVEQMYAKGLLTGDAKGQFNGTKGATRAEASTVVGKLIGVVQRATPAGSYINLNDPSRPPAKPGDKVIVNGVTYTVQVTPFTAGDGEVHNIIGYGIPAALDLGRDNGNGIPIKNGIMVQDGSANTGDVYLVWTTKGTGEGHYQHEWSAIAHNTEPKEPGTRQGEVRNTYWEWSEFDEWFFMPTYDVVR